MVLLKIGSVGEAVRQLQSGLNLLPTALALLKVDGIFGTRTHGRVREFQGFNPPLKVDGIFGDLSNNILQALLAQLKIPVTTGAVRSINQEILGMNGPGNLIPQVLPARMLVDTSSFRRNDKTNILRFTPFLMQAARLGLFAAKKGTSERCVMLMLPLLQKVDRILIIITQGFGQAAADLIPLGWTNPLSKKFIEFALLKHVVNRYGPQVIASKKNMGLMYILRAGNGPELGPFTNDGPFVKQTLQEMQALTNDAFTFGTVEAMTFSSGIRDFSLFLSSIKGLLSLSTVYNIDPNPATSVGPNAQQFLSGHTSGGTGRPGFELIPFERWRNEPLFSRPPPKSEFDYMHNKVMPNYCLHMGINLS
jgi:hypothetical protein